MKLKDIYRNKWVRFAFWGILYAFWVAWLGNWWWIAGEAVVFDLCVTKKVNWTFWKPRDPKKRNTLTEWVDAIIFAVIVVTFLNVFFIQSFKIPSSSMESSLMTGDHLFVSKLSYGPRVPQTPLTIPFTHNVIFGKKSYSTLIQNDYRRLRGFGSLKRYDPVVFGFPNGDTVLTKSPASDYYMLCRMYGKETVVSQWGPLMVHPTDKVDHYVKRCVALPGDTLLIENGVLKVNSLEAPVLQKQQTSYRVVAPARINVRILRELEINDAEQWYDPSLPGYPEMSLTAAQAAAIAALPAVSSCEPNVDVYPPDFPDSYLTIFPFSEDYKWTRDNFGPLWIPAKGSVAQLSAQTLPLYERIITAYEGHTLEVRGEEILVDGEPCREYRFAQDYYFMMGDNRHNSLDSRYWGFVPEDHIVGSPLIIWLSTDSSKKFPSKIRWNRFFKTSFSN